jgi:uncharacterized membrane protein
VQSRVRLLGHPIHPAVARLPLVVFPLLVGLDVLWRLTGSVAFWEVGGWICMAGIAGGIAAVLTGTVDLVAIPEGTRAYRVGAWHFLGGLATLSFYAFTMWVRWPVGSPPGAWELAVVFDVVGTGVAMGQGYLGTELRTRHHVGVPAVDEGAEPVALKR